MDGKRQDSQWPQEPENPPHQQPPAANRIDWVRIASLFRDGDVDAFRRIVETWEHEAIRFAEGLVRNVPTAEEMVQEAFLRAWQKRAALRDPARLRPWFYRILTNICRDYLRSPLARRNPSRNADSSLLFHPVHPGPSPVSEPEDPLPGPTERLLEKERSDTLGASLSRLSRNDQTLLGLRYGAELPIADIAKALRMRPNTVLSRIHRALKRLRADLDQMEETPPRANLAHMQTTYSPAHEVPRAPPHRDSPQEND